MPFTLITERKKNGNYYSYKSSYREDGKVKNKSIYLGTEEVAMKLLDDFNSKKPSNERLLTSSGEKILSRVLKMLDFQDIVNKSIKCDPRFDTGCFIEMIVIERALNDFSKYGLAQRAHGHSIFSVDKTIPDDKFTESNIYNYMDYLYPNVDSIQQQLVKKLLHIDGIKMNELVIDGTSVSCFGDDDDEFLDEEDDALGGTGEDAVSEKYADVKRVHGYNRDKRPDLAQVNIMLGVNDWSMPLLFQVFPGNAPDVHMFASILKKLHNGYPALLSRVQSKHVVFDKGNNNPDNIKKLDELCERWGFHFVASARPSMIVVKNELAMLHKENAPVIYTQENTVLRGRTTTATLYGKPRNVLLYLNEGIMKKKQDVFQQKLRQAKGEVRDVLQRGGPPEEKKSKVENLLRKHGLQSCFVVQVKKGIVTCTSVKEKINERASVLGKNVLFTNDFSLGAVEMMRIYKTTGVVEQEFHVLKSELGIGPVFHRRPDRIAVHFALILWGMMALALLRTLLSMRGVEYTFEQLQARIKEGHVSIGDFIYPGAKSFRVQKSLNINEDLQEIFHVLKIKWEYFDIEVLTTGNEDPDPPVTTT